MASAICTSCKAFILDIHSDYNLSKSESTEYHIYAIIAKGNIIEGIEAKE